MKKYVKNDIIKNACDIIVKKTIDGVEYDTYSPSEEDILEDGWVELVPAVVEPSLEEKLSIAKATKVNNVVDYDSSEEVNSFMVFDVKMWLDKATRAGLMLRFNSEKAAKKELTTLWYNDIKFEMPLNKAINMLYALEVYASECYDNTHSHIAAINALDTLEDIDNYDYTTGYPEKLNFTI